MKKYAIVYSSHTGNTALLANRLQEALPKKECIYFGAPAHSAKEAEIIMIGFWTDKGDADELCISFLKELHNKTIFLFGTAGFGGSDDYFNAILSRVEHHLDDSNLMIGTYMCQGKMLPSVRERYKAMEKQNPEKAQELIQNFDEALSHPNESDFKRLEERVWNIFQK